jgi:hypothetical protein
LVDAVALHLPPLAAVAKVISSEVSVLFSFRGEHIPPFYFSSQPSGIARFLRFLPPAAWHLFKSTYKLCNSENRNPSVNTEFPKKHLTQKACSNRCFFPPTLFLLEVGFTLANPTRPILCQRSGHFTCRFLFRFGAVKPSLQFLRFLSRLILV